jgi:hypothetical protein
MLGVKKEGPEFIAKINLDKHYTNKNNMGLYPLSKEEYDNIIRKAYEDGFNVGMERAKAEREMLEGFGRRNKRKSCKRKSRKRKSRKRKSRKHK